MIKYLLQMKIESEVMRLSEEREERAAEMCYYAGYKEATHIAVHINAKIDALNWVLTEMKTL